MNAAERLLEVEERIEALEAKSAAEFKELRVNFEIALAVQRVLGEALGVKEHVDRIIEEIRARKP